MRHVFLGSVYAISLSSLLLSSCSSASMTGNPGRIDPEAISHEIGSTEEIYEVSQAAVTALRGCSRLDSEKNHRVIVDNIINKTGIRGYDENIFYNKLLSQLVNDAGDRFTFLDRESVKAERELQISGEVESTNAPVKLVGADLVLKIELRSLVGVNTTTIQYALKLNALDGTIVCAPETVEIKKKS